jgi:D-lactate dehydrogenase
MNISIFGTKDWEAEYMKGKISGFSTEAVVNFFDGIVTPEKLPPEETEILCIFVDSLVNKEVIDKLPNLKMIVTRSTGFDHIDLEVAKARNIPVCYVPSYGENTVAEFSMALILCLSRNIYQSVDVFRETGKYSYDGLMGFDLMGKTLGVVGAGRIGRFLIKMAKGFDMKVIAYDPFPNEQFAKELQYEYKTFEEVLRESDVVSIHVPYSKDNHHLFNEKAFSMMKKGSLLINTARGPLVDTVALVSSLQSGHLGGAGLDVLEEEAILKDESNFILHGNKDEHNSQVMIANHVLSDMPNVLITPHTAFNTKEAIIRILDTTLEDIEGFLKGVPKNIVPGK